MLFPPQLGMKSHTKIFSRVGIWNFCAIDEDWLLSNLLVCEVTNQMCNYLLRIDDPVMWH
jgi:hypothetical protein